MSRYVSNSLGKFYNCLNCQKRYSLRATVGCKLYKLCFCLPVFCQKLELVISVPVGTLQKVQLRIAPMGLKHRSDRVRSVVVWMRPTWTWVSWISAWLSLSPHILFLTPFHHGLTRQKYIKQQYIMSKMMPKNKYCRRWGSNCYWRRRGPLRGSSSPLSHFEPVRVNPIKLAYDLCRPDGHFFTISSLLVAETIASTHCAYSQRDGQAE